MDLEQLQARLGHSFSRPELLVQALTHRSHSNSHNERLEFLGDSVLNCVIASELYRRFPRLKEGELSRLRANLVRQDALHQVAQSLALGGMLRLGEGEQRSGGSARPSILADTVEALLGAVFLDGGYNAARAATLRIFDTLLDAVDPKSQGKDPKTLLQEVLQSKRIPLPKYTVLATQGAAHDQRFEVECAVPELELRSTGSGATRRVAEQEAAMRVYELLGKP
jgi:ribonuclease-3